MADKEIIISLAGGIQQDESAQNPPPENRGVSSYEIGDYPYVLNMRVGSSVEDNTGAGELIASTLEISNYYTWDGSGWVSSSAPTGTNTAISKYEENGKLYWAVHNTNGDHHVLLFVKFERKIYELIKWSGLNFSLTKFVSMCKINKYLIITDKNSPPRILNVNSNIATVDKTQIFRLKQTLGASFSEYHISFAKWPPLAPPLVRKATSGTSDYTEKGIFQISYRYVYIGGMKSTFSPPSWFVTNEILGSGVPFSIYIPGYIFDFETPANTAFQHSSVKFYQIVEYIELAYRESTRDSWKLFKRHTVTSGDNINFEFSNNGPSARIASNDIGQYFDSVPFKSGSCEAIDNRPMFADNEDELPAVTNFDVEAVTVHSMTPGFSSWNESASGFSSLSGAQQTALQQIMDVRRMSFKERGIYKLGIVYQHFAGRENLATTLDKWTYTIPSSIALGAIERYHALGFNIPAGVTPPDWAVAYKIVRSNCLNIEHFVYGIVNNFKFLQNDANALNDELATPDSVKNVLKEYFDNNTVVSVANKLFKKSFGLVDRVLGVIRKNKSATSITAASRLYLDISNWVVTSKKDASATEDWPANNVFYQFQAGDRVRFWGSTSASFDIGDLVRFDEEIIEYTGKGIIVNKPENLVTMKTRTEASPNPSQAYVVEIYRPKEFNEDEDVVFYDIGEWYPITQPRTASRDFSKRDFRWTASTAVTASTVNGHTIYNKMPISLGDVWMVDKDFYFDFNTGFSGQFSGAKWPQMTQDPKRAWDFWERNTGRAYAAYVYLPTETDKPTQIRFGGKFLEDSLFVSINNFRDEWQHIYPSEYGRIRGLKNTANAQVESVGSILLVIGEVEAWSIYVNRTTLEDLSGRTQVSISDKVLGSYNTLLGQQGTLNPDSISAKNGRALWWNARVGEWVRYSRDGLTEISERGMKNWFKDLSDLLINKYSDGSSAPKVLSTFDDYHKCWVTYIQHADLPATFKGYSSYKCVTFAERNADKKWKEFIDLTPEVFASLDNETYSIIGSKIHIHEEGTDYGSFYGVKKDVKIEVVANPEVRKNKIWKAVALEASDAWSFESVKGDWRSNNGTRQETRMRIDDLQKKEWTFWTNIKKDKNTPNAASEQAGVVNGEGIRSKSLRIMMKLDPAVDYLSVFNYLIVTYDDSPVNPKK